MSFTKRCSTFGYNLFSGSRKRNARKLKRSPVAAAEVLEDRKLLSAVYGDFNGDGNLDEATGNPSATVGGVTDAGAVSVSYGSSAIETQLWSQDSPGIEGGAEADDLFGDVLAVGDFNNDGYDDLAIGVPWEDTGKIISAVKGGAVNVIYGSRFGLHASEAQKDQMWHQDSIEFLPGPFNQTVGIKGSAQRLDFFGSTLEVADFNNDGYADLAIGVPGESKGTLGASWTHHHGGVNIIYGSADGLTAVGNDYFDQDTKGIEGHAEGGDYFGSQLSHGDFNGDGYDDLAIGVRDENNEIGSTTLAVDSGGVNVIYGSSSGLRADGDQGWGKGLNGIPGRPTTDDRFGSQTISGDFNNDGYDDLAISVPGRFRTSVLGSGGSEVIVIYGSSNRLQAVTARGAVIETQVWSGKGNLSTDDFNGDGFADLRIGNSTVHYGSANGLKASSIFTAPTDQVLAPTSDEPVVQFPSAPRFLSPTPKPSGDPTFVAINTPKLTWTAVIRASEYEILIYDTLAGAEVVNEVALSTNSFTTPPLTAGRTYQTFVRAKNAAGTATPYSTPLAFTITVGKSTLPTPEKTDAIVATWTGHLRAVSYDLLAYDTALGKEVANVKGITGTSFDLSKSLAGISDFTVYTKANFSDGTAGAWAPVESVGQNAVDPIVGVPPVDVVPGVPTLLGPVGIGTDVKPKITWAKSTNASTYEILIYNKDNGQQVLNKSGIEFTSYTVQQGMAANTNYQVFVRSSAYPANSAWSSPLEFKTAATSSVAETPVFELSSGVQLSTRPAISWKPAANAATYEVLLYNKKSGQLVEQAQDIVKFQFTPTQALDSTGEYQMFVRGVNSSGQAGSWSAPLEFGISAPSLSTMVAVFTDLRLFAAI